MEPGGCNKEDCIYRSTNRGHFISCDYILKTGHSRNCEIGDKCDKYTPGEKEIYRWLDTLRLVVPFTSKK